MKLDERARRAAGQVRDLADTVDPAVVLEHVRGERPARRRALLLGMSAAAAVAAIVAVVALILPATDPGPVIDPVVPGEREPTPTERPSEPSTTTSAWTRSSSEAFGGPGDQALRAVDGRGDVTVAIGSDREQAGIWWSSGAPGDGGAWERVAPDLCGEASCTLTDVVASEVGFVATGSLDGLPKVWVSTDGLDWERVDLDLDGGPSVTFELSAVADGHREELVALGRAVREDGPARPVVLTSRDGRTWREAPTDVDFSEAGAHVVDAVGHGGSVTAVVELGDATALLVDAGGTWTVREIAADGFTTVTTKVHTITLAPGGDLWMLGSLYGEGDQDGAVWRSSDGGISWASTTAGLGGAGDQHVTGVLGVGDRTLLSGFELDAASFRSRPAAWEMGADGWHRVDDGDSFAVEGAMWSASYRAGNGPVVVGQVTADGADGADGAVWTAQVDALEVSSCSTAGRASQPPTEDPGLPPPVLDMRYAIWEAAMDCDLGTLESLALDGSRGFTYSFGEDGAPAAYWRRHEEEGAEPLLVLAQLLEGPSATVETQFEADVYETVHVWPPAFAEQDDYLGWRVGITEDGDWVFFVAGD